MRHVMIDIETLGTKVDCAVMTIGLVTFDENGIIGRFHYTLNVQDQIDRGRSVDYSTLQWWMDQDDSAKEVFNRYPLKVITQLSSLSYIINHKSEEDVIVWGNGSSFDISILEHLFNQYKLDIPWKFWNVRDLRTFRDYVYKGVDVEFKGTKHNALDDAEYQALIVIRGLQGAIDE